MPHQRGNKAVVLPPWRPPCNLHDAGTGVPADTARRWSSDNPADYQKVYNDVLELIARRGPFDGVMGFSEGGAVAAGALIADAQLRFADFRGGIFFCATTPQDLGAALATGTVRDLDPARDGVVIDVPTAHVWSDRDRVHKDMGRDLVGLCRIDLRSEFVHGLGHDVPGARASDKDFAGALLAVERTVERMRRGRGPRV